MESHLLQMRGLKPHTHTHTHTHVASFTDAWIETDHIKGCGLYRQVASFTDAWIETVLFRFV